MNLFYDLRRLERKIDAIIHALIRKGELDMSALSDLQAQAAATVTAEENALKAAQALGAAHIDPAAVAAVTAQLKTSADALTAGVAALAAPAYPILHRDAERAAGGETAVCFGGGNN